MSLMRFVSKNAIFVPVGFVLSAAYTPISLEGLAWCLVFGVAIALRDEAIEREAQR